MKKTQPGKKLLLKVKTIAQLDSRRLIAVAGASNDGCMSASCAQNTFEDCGTGGPMNQGG